MGIGLLERSTQGVSLGDYVSGKKGEEVKRHLFQKIGWLSLILRQARVTLDCFSIGNDEPAAEAGFSKKRLRRKSESRTCD
jgi:hypothetical protein